MEYFLNEVYCSYINKNIEENKLKNVNLINAVLSDKSELLYIENESVKSKDINNNAQDAFSALRGNDRNPRALDLPV